MFFLYVEPERSDTTCLTAHRLITGALGMKPQLDEEKVLEEKKKISEAKGVLYQFEFDTNVTVEVLTCNISTILLETFCHEKLCIILSC